MQAIKLVFRNRTEGILASQALLLLLNGEIYTFAYIFTLIENIKVKTETIPLSQNMLRGFLLCSTVPSWQ